MLPFPRLFNTFKLSEYELFVAEIQSVPSVTVFASTPTTISNSNRDFKCQMDGSLNGSFYGSPINSAGYGNVSRLAQLCFPSVEIFNYYLEHKLIFKYTITNLFTSTAPAITRNGYTSSAITSDKAGMTSIIEFIYYDPFQEKVMVYNPSAIGSSPRPYFGIVDEYDRLYNEIKNYPILTDSDDIPSVISFFQIRANVTEKFMNNSANSLYGSSTLQMYSAGGGSKISRAIQHAVPDEETYKSIASSGTLCMILLSASIVDGRITDVPAITKNGYTSKAIGYASSAIFEIVYYDNKTGYVMRCNPRSSDAPSRYYLEPSEVSGTERFYQTNKNRKYISDCTDAIVASQLTAGEVYNLYLKAGGNTLMFGSPYKKHMGYKVNLNRAAQHMLPSEEIYNLHSSGKVPMFNRARFSRYQGYYSENIWSVNRNGYTSSNWGSTSTVAGLNCIEFIYYDTTTGEIMWYSPVALNSEPQLVYKDISEYSEYEKYLDNINLHPSNQGNAAYVYTNEQGDGFHNTNVGVHQRYTFLTTTPRLGRYTLRGSSWGSYFVADGASGIHGAIQHGLPNVDSYNNVINYGRFVSFKIEIQKAGDLNITSLTEVNRNGLISSNVTNIKPDANLGKITEIIYYDDTTGYMMKINPFEMSSPIRYF